VVDANRQLTGNVRVCAPFRCWPGNTTDSALIRQVKADLRDWTLARVIWVADRGFASAENRRYLRRGDHHDIIGERLRSGSAVASAALSRQGRYQQVAGNLRVKEVRIAEAERFVICYNPEQADRDAAVRARLLAQLEETIAASDKRSAAKRAELRGVISTKPGLARFLRSPRVGCCAPTSEPSRPSKAWTAPTCCAPLTPTCRPRTSRPPAATPGQACAASWSGSSSAPSPAPPGPPPAHRAHHHQRAILAKLQLAEPPRV